MHLIEEKKNMALSKGKITSRLKGQKTVGFCSFVANFSQQFFAS
jgi:hypothetical protein